MINKVEIKTDGQFANICIDGKEIKNVTGYKLEHSVDGLPVLKLELINPEGTFIGNTIDCRINKKYTLLEKDKKIMEERLKELKEKITSFVNDYDIQEFTIWIEEDGSIDKKVTLEIRV